MNILDQRSMEVTQWGEGLTLYVILIPWASFLTSHVRQMALGVQIIFVQVAIPHYSTK